MKKQVAALVLGSCIALSLSTSATAANNATADQTVNYRNTNNAHTYGTNDVSMLNQNDTTNNGRYRAYATDNDDGFDWGWLGLLGLLGLAGMRSRHRERDRA